jgi:hypothetical protein
MVALWIDKAPAGVQRLAVLGRADVFQYILIASPVVLEILLSLDQRAGGSLVEQCGGSAASVWWDRAAVRAW